MVIREVKSHEDLLQQIRTGLIDAVLPDFAENDRRIFDLRYALKNEQGEADEDPRATIWRVASNVASVTPLYLGRREGSWGEPAARDGVPLPAATAVRQYNWLMGEGRMNGEFGQVMLEGADVWLERAKAYQRMLTNRDFLPNSPTWTGAGTGLGQLAACFVLPISDDLGRNRASIFETLKVAVLIQQTGGGNGFSFSQLRPNGALVKRSMGRATGPMGFLGVYNAAFGEIAQGGTRRGANMGVMRISHPDVLDFIRSKIVEGEISNFNLSVAVEDAFMKAVDEDGEWTMRWSLDSESADPTDEVVERTIGARELYDEIIRCAWELGDPGNLFIDRANRDNPVPARYVLEATNPCGEQWLGPYENCCLGSIAVSRFADWDTGFDWEAFRKTVVLATEFLDDVVDANAYVPDVPELETAAQGGRRIGLGLMGLADAMLILGIRYGSPEGEQFMSEVTEFARYHCMLTSIRRAEERGPFGWIEGSIYDPQLLAEKGPGAEFSGPMIDGSGRTFNSRLWDIPTPLVPDYTTFFGRPDCDWGVVLEGIKAHGIRNSCQFTFAPTGTISNVAGLEGSGCEPLFALSYIRTVMQEGQNIQLPYLSRLFQTALERAGIDEDQQAVILAKMQANNGSCQGIEEVPEEIRRVFVVAADVTPEEHVRAQAVLQRFVDNSISKTINLPNEATVEDVERAYRLAYDLGCKGITVYRQGSREVEVLATKPAAQTGAVEVVDEGHWPFIEPMQLPDYVETDGLPSRTLRAQTPFGKLHVYLTELRDHPGRPFDTRLQFGKAGNDKAADIEAMGRLISLCFRLGGRVDDVVDQLEGIGGRSQMGFRDKRVLSSPDAIGKLLMRLYMPDQWAERYSLEVNGNGSAVAKPVPNVLKPIAEMCPQCHNYSVVFEQGCKYCKLELGGCGDKIGCD